MPSETFRVDIKEITALARVWGGPQAHKIVVDEQNTAMIGSLHDVQDAANARVKHKTGNYSRSFKREVRNTATGVLGILRNAAASSTGFVYATTLEYGRKGFSVVKAKALRFEIGGQVFFRHSVGPAPAQHPMEFGVRDAEPKIYGRFGAARDRIAVRLQAMR